MPTGYCEPEDVAGVLQEGDRPFSGSPSESEAASAITGLTEYLRRKTGHHWYEPSAQTDLVPSTTRSQSTVRLDVPSSPHRQDRQLFRAEQGVRYPVTHAGPYARIRLPHHDVQSVTTLAVRDRAGGVTDWVAASDKVAGRGDDYYVLADSETGRSHLYIRAASIGPRVDFGDLLTVGYDYGTEITDTIRTGVAHLAAAALVLDDDVEAAVPDDGQLVAVETKADRHINEAMRRLGPFFERPVA